MNSNMKKLVIVAVIALILWLLITQPHQTADGVHNILDWLKNAARSIITFVRDVFS